MLFLQHMCSLGSSCDYNTALLWLSITIVLCTWDQQKSAFCFQQERYSNWPYVQIWVTSFCEKQRGSTKMWDVFSRLLAHKYGHNKDIRVIYWSGVRLILLHFDCCSTHRSSVSLFKDKKVIIVPHLSFNHSTPVLATAVAGRTPFVRLDALLGVWFKAIY